MNLYPLNFRRCLCVCLDWLSGAALLFLFGLSPASAASPADSSPPMSLDQYKAELHRVEKAIEDQRDHFQPPAGRSEKLNLKIPDVWTVDIQGQRYEVPTSELKIEIADLKDRASQRNLALNADLARIRALEQEVDKLDSPSRAPAADSARAHLQEILSHREFNRSQEKKSWLREMWEKFWNWIEEMFDRLFNAVSRNKPVRNLVLYGIIVVGFVALAWTLVRVLGSTARRESLRLEAPAFSVKTSGQWAREAMAAAARGDYRDAIHCGYWAGVYRLAEIGIWDLDESRTPREYLRLLSARPREDDASVSAWAPTGGATLPDPSVLAARAQALSALTRSFESVWYADQPATQQDFTSAVTHLEKLECRFPSTAPTAGS